MPVTTQTKPDGSTMLVNATNGVYAALPTDILEHTASVGPPIPTRSSRRRLPLGPARQLHPGGAWAGINNAGELERHLPESPSTVAENVVRVGGLLIEGIGTPIVNPTTGFSITTKRNKMT